MDGVFVVMVPNLEGFGPQEWPSNFAMISIVVRTIFTHKMYIRAIALAV